MSPSQDFDAANPYQSPHETPEGGPVNSSSDQTANLLRQTRPWVRLLAILGFVSVGLMVLFAGSMLAMAAFSGGNGMPMGQAAIMAVVYVVMGGLYIFPSMYLLSYAKRIGVYLDQGNTESLNLALEAQKSFWKFVGIMMAVILCFYAVIIVFGLLAMVIGLANQ